MSFTREACKAALLQQKSKIQQLLGAVLFLSAEEQSKSKLHDIAEPESTTQNAGGTQIMQAGWVGQFVPRIVAHSIHDVSKPEGLVD